MNIKSIVWVANTSKFGSGKFATVGKIRIGSWEWNGIDRDESKQYIAKFHLPGFKDSSEKFPNEEMAIAFVEKRFRVWMKEMLTD